MNYKILLMSTLFILGTSSFCAEKKYKTRANRYFNCTQSCAARTNYNVHLKTQSSNAFQVVQAALAYNTNCLKKCMRNNK